MKKNAPGHASREMNKRAFHTRTSERRLGTLVIAVQGHSRSWGIFIEQTTSMIPLCLRNQNMERKQNVSSRSR